MIDWDKWQEIFDSINRHRLRTLLTGFGVAWGIFMLVLLLGAGQGLQNGVEYQFAGDIMNSLWIESGRTTKPYAGMKAGRRIELTDDDYAFLQSEFPEIFKSSGKYFVGGSVIVTYGAKTQSFSVQGTHVDGDFIESLQMLEGRYLNQHDIDEERKVAVIGKDVREEFFDKDEDPLGKEVVVDGAVFKVIGVFYDPEEGRTMKRLYVPISTVQTVYSNFDQIDEIILGMGDLSIDGVMAIEDEINAALKKRKKVAPDDRQAIDVFNSAEEFKNFMGLMTAIKGIMWIVGIFSIIAGVIGVSNIMLIIVKDRTKEIGIRKALGATPRSIVGMIFQESIFITAIAGYIGLCAGVGLLAVLQGIESDFFRQPEINFGIAIAATIVLILAGGLAGLLPALQASRINPVKAIKSD